MWWTLYHNWKTFNGPYFLLFLLSSVMVEPKNHVTQYVQNLTGYLTTWPLLHLPNVICKDCWLSSVYKQEYIVWLTPIRFIFRYCTQLSSISEVALAFNRFTAIAFHLHHRKVSYVEVWKRQCSRSKEERKSRAEYINFSCKRFTFRYGEES